MRRFVRDDVTQAGGAALGTYFEVMSEEVPSLANLRFYLKYLFEGVDLAGKRMLEVGASRGGTYSVYAACKGAAEVVSLHALDAGSTAGTVEELEKVADRLDLTNIRFVPGRLQNGTLPEGSFDVLLLHASINHLDEDACVGLRHDRAAREVYLELLSELARIAAPDAKLIAVDCSPHNLFARFGKNPLAPTIEWEKHQPPEVWVELLKTVGFTRPKIRWNSINTLRGPGRILLGNRFAAYCLTSVFCLTMDRR